MASSHSDTHAIICTDLIGFLSVCIPLYAAPLYSKQSHDPADLVPGEREYGFEIRRILDRKAGTWTRLELKSEHTKSQEMQG